MKIPLYIVDAFTSEIFKGNPAAVCPLKEWLPSSIMQKIAAENNLAETAFLVVNGSSYDLRWFTPTVEVDLCGHATLASAFVLSQMEGNTARRFTFNSKSGELLVTKQEDLFSLNFPIRLLEEVDKINEVESCLNAKPIKVTKAGNTYIAEYKDEATIKAIKPNLQEVKKLDCQGLSITAPGNDVDFVSRFFAPKAGINEDQVTGSVHCGLTPYWHNRLDKVEMSAKQLSQRGGDLICQYAKDRVIIKGKAVLFSSGYIYLSSFQ